MQARLLVPDVLPAHASARRRMRRKDEPPKPEPGKTYITVVETISPNHSNVTTLDRQRFRKDPGTNLDDRYATCGIQPLRRSSSMSQPTTQGISLRRHRGFRRPAYAGSLGRAFGQRSFGGGGVLDAVVPGEIGSARFRGGATSIR